MAEQKEKTYKRRRLNTGNHRWSDLETRDLLEAVVDETKDNVQSFEKPTSQQFYGKIAEKTSRIRLINWQTMKSRMRYLKSLFIAAVKWKNQTGARLLADGDEKSVSEHITKICPYWSLLEQVFGGGTSIDPSVLSDTSSEIGLTQDTDISFDALDNRFEGIIRQPEVCSLLECSKQKRDEVNGDSISLLVTMQEKRLNFEKMKWKKQMEMEAEQLELSKKKAQNEVDLKRLELEKEIEIKKLELERDERIAMARMKLEIESHERLRKYELELKQKGDQF